jgi:hypothetical protein
MLNVKVTGLENLQRNLEEAGRALAALNRTVATVKFNPADPQSVAEAICQMEAAVDERIAPYAGNSLVADVAAKFKAAQRSQILKLAETPNDGPAAN